MGYTVLRNNLQELFLFFVIEFIGDIYEEITFIIFIINYIYS